MESQENRKTEQTHSVGCENILSPSGQKNEGQTDTQMAGSRITLLGEKRTEKKGHMVEQAGSDTNQCFNAPKKLN